jgi:hypothetical protein
MRDYASGHRLVTGYREARHITTDFLRKRCPLIKDHRALKQERRRPATALRGAASHRYTSYPAAVRPAMFNARSRRPFV